MANLTSSEQKLLKLIAEYRILLTRQIAALKCIGLRAAQKILRSIYEKEYIKTTPHSSEVLKGRPENVTSLSTKGAELLLAEGAIDPSVSVKMITGEGITHKDHELLINWFRIHLLHLDKQVSVLETDFISGNTPFLRRRTNGLPLISDSIPNNATSDWFIPDGVFSIKNRIQNKRLLFFLEVDCATEPIQSANKNATTIAKKVRNYQIYFQNKGHKRYEKKWPDVLNGFRVLFVTTNQERKMSITRHLERYPSTDFIWSTDIEQVFSHGLGARIWLQGGKIDAPLDSILGPTLACNLTLPTY